MRFDVSDLRLFVAAAELGSLTRAAARQHLSLAAASGRVRSLEEQSGLLFFAREVRGLRLLPPGEAFLHRARQILGQSELLQDDLRAYREGVQGQLRLMANTTAATDILPSILPSFLNMHPQVSIDLLEQPNAAIPAGVLQGRADLGIVAGDVDKLGLHSVHFNTDRLVLVTPLRHRFARRRSIAFVDTLNEDAIGMRTGSTLQTFLQRVAGEMGAKQKLRVQLCSFDAICRMIASGVGIGVLPESAAQRHAAMGLALVPLIDCWSVRERHLLMRDRATLPRFGRALVDALSGSAEVP